MSTPIIPQTLLRDAGTYETHLWLAAEALFHRERPTDGPLIDAPAEVRGRFLQLAVLASRSFTERGGPRWAEQRAQAATDYALHRETGRRQDPLRFYQLSREGR